MSILLLAMGMVSLAAPLWTQSLFRTEWVGERRQIAVDNAGILLGRRDTAMFNNLIKANQALAALDRAHDPVHLCAHGPGAAQCLAADQEFELQIESAHRAALELAERLWDQGRREAEGEARRLGVRIEVKRSASPPLKPIVCPVCGKEIGWDSAVDSPFGYRVVATPESGEEPARTVDVWVFWKERSTREGKPWNYQLRPLSTEAFGPENQDDE